MKLLRLTLLSLACLLPAICLAQWQWIDKDGRKVFSDRPPPSDIPAKNIIKQPGLKGQSTAVVEADPSAAASQPVKPAASAPKISGKDKTLEDKKRQAEAADAEKKKIQEEELAKTRADNCARAKSAKTAFDSGARITRANEKGEREYLDDAARAAESKRLAEVITSNCKSPG